MEYLIEFGGKKIALSQMDIAQLYPAIQPYFLAILQGLNEVETVQFVSDYSEFLSQLERGGGDELTQTPQKSKITKSEPSKEKSETGIVIDFNSRRRQKYEQK